MERNGYAGERNRVAGALLAAAVSAACALPATAAFADAARGKMVYETRCVACHESSVHQQSARKAQSFAALRVQVQRWSEEVGGAWTADEIDDVTLYLNERYYHYPCPQTLCRAERASAAR